jgi:DNA polymerase III epsilon subunit-like protein
MLVIDVETSGLDPSTSSIVSIGAVDFLNPANQYYAECRVFDGAHISDESIAVNGFTRAQLADPARRSNEAVLREFLLWATRISHRVIAGQNINFDFQFLLAGASRFRIHFPLGGRVVDLHGVAYAHMLAHGFAPPLKDGKSTLSLDAILAYVGMPPEPRPHIAINGAKLEAEAFSRVIFGKGLLPEFAQYPVPPIILRRPPVPPKA